MYCQNCGKKLSEGTSVCDNCNPASKSTVVEEKNQEKQPVKKNYLGVAISLITFVLVFSVVKFVTQEGVKYVSSSSEKASLEENLSKMVIELNRNLPKTENGITQLPMSSSGKEIIYSYSVPSTQMSFVEFDNNLKNTMPRQVCANKDTRDLLALGAKMTYKYYIADRNALFGIISITSTDCL